MKRLMLTPLTQIFSGGVSFSPEAKTGRRRRSKAIFLPTDRPISIKSLRFPFSQMNFVWHQILLVVLESAVVALLLQLSLPPPPVAPITAGGAVSPSGSCKTWPPSLPPLFSLSPSFFLLLWLRQTGGSEVTWWRFLCGSVTSPQLCVSVLSMAMMRQHTMWVVAATRWPPPKNCYLAPLGALYAMMRPNWLDTEPSNISLSPYFLHFFPDIWKCMTQSLNNVQCPNNT